MLEIIQLPVLKDNYIYVLHDHRLQKTAVVDPAEAEPVIELLNNKGWNLDYILNTHHHNDHVGGNRLLKANTGCQIMASYFDAERIPGVDIRLREGDEFLLGESLFKVIDTPGHTYGHICYFQPETPALFCGDTLFSLGCGRLFEGTAKELWHSLNKIKALPTDTRIYCAHEYTLANAKFALSIDPENPALNNRHQEVIRLREQGLPTVPVALATELLTNPFLRIKESDHNYNANNGEAEIERFSQLRHLKDIF